MHIFELCRCRNLLKRIHNTINVNKYVKTIAAPSITRLYLGAIFLLKLLEDMVVDDVLVDDVLVDGVLVVVDLVVDDVLVLVDDVLVDDDVAEVVAVNLDYHALERKKTTNM